MHVCVTIYNILQTNVNPFYFQKKMQKLTNIKQLTSVFPGMI